MKLRRICSHPPSPQVWLTTNTRAAVSLSSKRPPSANPAVNSSTKWVIITKICSDFQTRCDIGVVPGHCEFVVHDQGGGMARGDVTVTPKSNRRVGVCMYVLLGGRVTPNISSARVCWGLLWHPILLPIHTWNAGKWTEVRVEEGC